MAMLTASPYCHHAASVPSAATAAQGDPPGPGPSADQGGPSEEETAQVVDRRGPGRVRWAVDTTKLRKYWGGRGDEDPVTATDDFICNGEFVDRMKRLIRDDSAPNPIPWVDIDLSKELEAPPKPLLEQQVEAARHSVLASQSYEGASLPRWRLVPTWQEQAKSDRAAKAATGGSNIILRESKRAHSYPKILAAQAREDYFKLKKRLQLLMVRIGGVGVVSAYVSYSPEIAASFGAGLLGSLIYIRILGNTVDSMADGARGLVKRAAGQPRLLAPVVLVRIYNRWNGFATSAQAIQDAMTVVDKRSSHVLVSRSMGDEGDTRGCSPQEKKGLDSFAAFY